MRRGRTLLATSASVATAVVLMAGPAYAAAETPQLNPGEQLNAGQRLVSANGQYVLVMQGDGNLVEYAPGNRAIWATGTGVANSVVFMQGDGNLVVIAPGNRPVWSTGTSGNPGADLELQTDANIVVYASGHVARWASGSTQSALGDRVRTTALNEAANASRNYETGTNCNFYSGAVSSGTPCSGAGSNWRAEEWCADFARWVWRGAGARTDGLTAAAGTFASYGKAKGTWKAGSSPANARIGDAVVYNLSGSYASHVGIVTGINGNGTIAVTSGNESNKVLTQTITPGSSGVSGYTSPVS